jgi:hypothetical protein
VRWHKAIGYYHKINTGLAYASTAWSNRPAALEQEIIYSI